MEGVGGGFGNKGILSVKKKKVRTQLLFGIRSSPLHKGDPQTQTQEGLKGKSKKGGVFLAPQLKNPVHITSETGGEEETGRPWKRQKKNNKGEEKGA